jgi:hypothetical protein
MDILHNPSQSGLNKISYCPFYLGIADAYSHAFFMVGMQACDTKAIIKAIEYYAVYHRPTNEFLISDIKEIHADAGTYFMSSEFMQWCTQDPLAIVVKVAAPKHQEQNGLVENRWQVTRLRCLKMLSHA